MRLVTDTNTIGYLLLETAPHHVAIEELFSRPCSLYAPASWEAELANVLWMAARARVVTPQVAQWKLRLAAGLGVESVPIDELWYVGLQIAIAEDHPVYDTLFVALARQLEATLVTYDKAVLRKFSDVARRAEDLLGT